MVGLIIMLTVSAVIGWLASLFVGTLGGFIIGVVIFVVWFRFNQNQGTNGLYKANLSSYFSFRKRGRTVGDALQMMIEARYRFSETNLNAALWMLSGIPESETDEMRVVEAVFSVFCIENGLPPEAERYRSEIRNLYRKMSQISGFS